MCWIALLVETIGMDIEPANLKLAAPPELDLDGPVNTTFAGAFENRAELKAAEAQTQVAELDQSAARKERLPKLQAFGDYGALRQGPDQSLGTFAVGASVTVPLWTGRRIESRIAAATARPSSSCAKRNCRLLARFSRRRSRSRRRDRWWLGTSSGECVWVPAMSLLSLC